MSKSSGSAKQDKDARREAARAQAEQLRKSQAARERRSRNILLGVLGGVIVIVVAIGAFIFTQSQKTLLDDFDGAVPANTDNRGGISVGNVGTAGTVNEGAPVLQVYLDFMCPYCGQFEEANADDLEKLRTAGDLTVNYHIVSNLDQASTTGFSTRATNAAVTIANDAPEQFVAFVEGMFANQPEEGGPGLSDEEIKAIAIEAGVPTEVADTLADAKFNEWISVSTQQAKRDGANGTPTVKFEGKKVPQDVMFYNAGVLGAWIAAESGTTLPE